MMKEMKKIAVFLMLVFAMVIASPVNNVVHAEVLVNMQTKFADPVFREWVQKNVDGINGTKDGKVSYEELKAVKKMDLSELKISTLEGNFDNGGIHEFVNLEWLSVSYTNIESLDLTGLTKLKTLYCRYDKKLTSIDFGGITSLQYLYCNNSDIRSLDLNGLTGLIQLKCNGNNTLAELKNLGSSKLTVLDCSYCALTSLDVRNLPAITMLDCSYNKNSAGKQLSTLNIGNRTKLKALYCHNNAIKNLTVAGCTALEDLHCNDNKLTGLNVSKNTALKTLWCEYNDIIELDVSNNKNLYDLRCHSNRNLSTLKFGNNAALQELHCASTSITSLNPAAFPNLTMLDCGDAKITSLNLSNNKALKELYCSGCKIGTLDIRGLSNLKTVYCTSCNLTNLELGGNAALETLVIMYNQGVTKLNLDDLVNMVYLRCRSTGIRVLDMSKNKPLSDRIGQNNAKGEPYIIAEPDVVYVRYQEHNPDEIAAAKEAAARAGIPDAIIDKTLHIVIPNWTNYRGNIVAVDNNGRLIRYTGAVTWRGYYLLIANGALYKQPTFFRDKADGKWRYFVNGVQTRNNNTFVSQFGKLWHVNNGVLDTTDCFVRYNGKFVYSYHGMAATSYTGWVQYDQYKCYLVNGVLTKITR